MSLLLFGVSPSIHKKSKLQTTNYCCQKLPFRCFWVLSSLQQIYFLFINITFLFNSITFFCLLTWQLKMFLWKNDGTISTHRNQRKKYQEVGLLPFTIQRFRIFSKNKKNYTEIICVKHWTANKYYWCWCNYITVLLY